MTATKRFHHQFLPDVIRYEKDAFTEETITILESKGIPSKKYLVMKPCKLSLGRRT